MKAKSLSMIELLNLETTCSLVDVKEKLSIQSDDKLFNYILLSIKNIINNKYTHGVEFSSYDNVIKNARTLLEELVKKESFSFHFTTKRIEEINSFIEAQTEFSNAENRNFAIAAHGLLNQTYGQILSRYQKKLDYDPLLLGQTLEILSNKKISLTDISEIVRLNNFSYYDSFFAFIYSIALRELKTINSENYGKSKRIIDNCINSYLLLSPVIGLYDDPKLTGVVAQMKSLLNESLNRKEQFMSEDRNTRCLKYLGTLSNSLGNAMSKYNRMDKLKINTGVSLPVSEQQRMLIVAEPDNLQDTLTILNGGETDNSKIVDNLPIRTGIIPFYFSAPIDTFNTTSTAKVDFRNKLVLTIDQEHSKMLDDGFSISKDKSGNFVLYYFQPYLREFLDNNSEVRDYARNVGEAIFGIGRTILQYPPSVCLEKFSLLRGKDTDTEVFIMNIDRYGNVLSFDRQIGVARSSYQLNYGQASKILSEGCRDYELTRSMNELNELVHILREKDDAKRTVAYLGEEISYSSSPPQRIVQEIAILSGEQRGKYLISNGIPGIFRAQEQPRLMEVYNTVIEDKKKVDRLDTFRIIPRAFYTANGNDEHFGLKIAGYTHGATLRRSVAEFNQLSIDECNPARRPTDATLYRFEQEAHDLATYVNDTQNGRDALVKKLGSLIHVTDKINGGKKTSK